MIATCSICLLSGCVSLSSWNHLGQSWVGRPKDVICADFDARDNGGERISNVLISYEVDHGGPAQGYHSFDWYAFDVAMNKYLKSLKECVR